MASSAARCSTCPGLVTLAAVALGRDRLTPRRAAALVVSSCGTLLILLGGGGVSLDVVGGCPGLRRCGHLRPVHPRRGQRGAPHAAGRADGVDHDGRGCRARRERTRRGWSGSDLRVRRLVLVGCIGVVCRRGGDAGLVRRPEPCRAIDGRDPFGPVVTTALAAVVLDESLKRWRSGGRVATAHRCVPRRRAVLPS